MLRRSFTLVEVIVVLVIILVVTGIVVSQFKAETPDSAVESASENLQSFLSMVRYKAAENGRDYVVRYDYGGKTLSATPDYSEAELEQMRQDGEKTPEKLTWKLHERCTMNTEDGAESDLTSDSSVEVFRFFADGGAGVSRRLILRCENRHRSFDFTFFSGKMVVTNTDAAEEYAASGKDRSTEEEVKTVLTDQQ